MHARIVNRIIPRCRTNESKPKDITVRESSQVKTQDINAHERAKSLFPCLDSRPPLYSPLGMALEACFEGARAWQQLHVASRRTLRRHFLYELCCGWAEAVKSLT